jgi:hypothetical protein
MTSASRIGSLSLLVALLGVCAVFAAETAGPIDPERISQTVKVLASDEFEGRAPGTPGETRTIEWLSKPRSNSPKRANRECALAYTWATLWCSRMAISSATASTSLRV